MRYFNTVHLFTTFLRAFKVSCFTWHSEYFVLLEDIFIPSFIIIQFFHQYHHCRIVWALFPVYYDYLSKDNSHRRRYKLNFWNNEFRCNNRYLAQYFNTVYLFTAVLKTFKVLSFTWYRRLGVISTVDKLKRDLIWSSSLKTYQCDWVNHSNWWRNWWKWRRIWRDW